jgi:hypothetical protein
MWILAMSVSLTAETPSDLLQTSASAPVFTPSIFLALQTKNAAATNTGNTASL